MLSEELKNYFDCKFEKLFDSQEALQAENENLKTTVESLKGTVNSLKAQVDQQNVRLDNQNKQINDMTILNGVTKMNNILGTTI